MMRFTLGYRPLDRERAEALDAAFKARGLDIVRPERELHGFAGLADSIAAAHDHALRFEPEGD